MAVHMAVLCKQRAGVYTERKVRSDGRRQAPDFAERTVAGRTPDSITPPLRL